MCVSLILRAVHVSLHCHMQDFVGQLPLIKTKHIVKEPPQNPTLRLEKNQVVVIYFSVGFDHCHLPFMLVTKIKHNLNWPGTIQTITNHAICKTDDLVSDPGSDPTLNHTPGKTNPSQFFWV